MPPRRRHPPQQPAANSTENPDGTDLVNLERHVSWLELFFDLVVVVAVAQLAHRLHGAGGEPGWSDVGAFVQTSSLVPEPEDPTVVRSEYPYRLEGDADTPGRVLGRPA